ncbi:carbohydrate porin [Colwellia hornerae]|nr:carbohydrate porin [Colwellia hornerae]
MLNKISSITLFFITIATTEVKALETRFSSDITVDSSFIDNNTFTEPVIRGLLNVGFETKLTSLIGKQSYIFVGYALQRGEQGSDIAGDIQGFSNIDEKDFNHAFEVILAVELSEKLFVKLGQMDANSDFANTKYGQEFINSSMGVSPTIQGLPTYPQPSMGLYSQYKLNSAITTRLGYYESSAKYNHFDDFFSIAEVQWHYQGNSSVKLGVWNHSHRENSDRVSASATDIYIAVDHYFNEKFSAFMQWGQAKKKVAIIEKHFSIGVNYQGLFSEEDTLGLGFTQADVVAAASEQVTELFYLYPLNDKINIKPDLQFISSPSGNKLMGDLVIFTLRLSAQF